MGSDVQALVNRLNQLHDGWKVQCELIALGQEAVMPLVQLLLSPPSIFPQPRCWAAEALGIIGGNQAVEGLCRVLSYHDVTGADPVVRLAEETIRNCAAEQLERLGDPRAIAPLLQALRRHPLPAAAQALASLDVDAAISLTICYLEDDFVRDRMASALLAFGPKIVDPLIETLHQRRTLEDEEAPGSIGRRAAAASLLGELGDARAVGALRPLLKECALEVRVEAAVALTQLAEGTVFAAAVSSLIGCLAAEHPRVRARAEEGLHHAGLPAVLHMVQTLEETIMIEKDGVTVPLPHETLVRIIRLLADTPNPEVTNVLRSIAIDSNVEIRAETIRAMGRLRDPEGISLLIYALRKDDDPRVRATAAEALGMFRTEAVLDPLVGALKERHPMVRRAAAHALARLGPLAEPCLQQAVKQNRWALSLDRQRLAWEARRLLRHIKNNGQAPSSPK
jgi:HEAT repeat protein